MKPHKINFYFIALLLSTLSASSFSQGIGNKQDIDFYTRIGSLDHISETEVVVSDRAYALSKLVSCVDSGGSVFVGCSGIEKAKWVEVSVEFDTERVVRVRKLSESQYKKALENDN